jgi:large subunit ribosomal protein L29
MRELHVNRIREMSADEVKIKIKDLREELFNLSFRNSMRQLDNPLKIRETRRDLARLMTVLEEHQRGIRPLGETGVKAESTGKVSAEGTKPVRAKAKAKAKTKAKAAAKPKPKPKAKAKSASRAKSVPKAKTAGKAKSAPRAKSAGRAKAPKAK